MTAFVGFLDKTDGRSKHVAGKAGSSGSGSRKRTVLERRGKGTSRKDQAVKKRKARQPLKEEVK